MHSTSHRRRVLVAILVVPALFSLRAIAQTSPNDDLTALLTQLLAKISLLEQTIQRLEARIAVLESGAGAATPSAEPLDAASGDHPVLLIESIEPLGTDQTLLAQARTLESEADDAARRAAEARKKEKEFSTIPHRWLLNEDDEREKELEYRRLREKYRIEARNLELEEDRKRKRAARLRDEAAQPRHVIRGWNGRIDVTIQTTPAASRALHQAEIGDFLEWVGTREAANDNREVWVASRVKRVARPADFQNRP